MANLRKIDCEHYSACLDMAAKQRGKFDCTGCERYSRMEAMEEGFEHELNGKGIGGTDNTVQLSVSARKDQEVRMETQAEYKPTSKKCTKCGKDKPLEAFAASKVSKFGHYSRCRECIKKQSAEYWLKRGKFVRKDSGKHPAKPRDPIAPGSTVLKKLVDKARAAKAAMIDGGTDKPSLSVNHAPASWGQAQALAEEHWEYIRRLLVTHGDDGDPDELAKIEFHYKSAMIHGYKHGQADAG